ncbi:extensin-like [Diachasma alloeum]|uniref:extensin-like n=1 Tax=Diachasma alloeum TaxID=454923 RepID=UPI000738227C|nr:extensin-like [Diachasma alloeum]
MHRKLPEMKGRTESRHQAEPPKKRGRPPGSKNKATDSPKLDTQGPSTARPQPRPRISSAPAVAQRSTESPGDTIASRLRPRLATQPEGSPASVLKFQKPGPRPIATYKPRQTSLTQKSPISKPYVPSPPKPALLEPEEEDSVEKSELEAEVVDEEVFVEIPKEPDNPALILIKESPRTDSDSEDETADEPPLDVPPGEPVESEEECEDKGEETAEVSPTFMQSINRSFAEFDKAIAERENEPEEPTETESSVDASCENIKESADLLYQQYLL